MLVTVIGTGLSYSQLFLPASDVCRNATVLFPTADLAENLLRTLVMLTGKATKSVPGEEQVFLLIAYAK
jgi:hypothetical protein